ncbi:hypothetical protein A8H39_08410 [Paraburkholderia fungorum]|nr:hypothetical protein A8H39_08410 [Paraburkholderia fungorum]
MVLNKRIGARSAAGGMTALSPRRSARGHRFQMHHYRGCAGDPLMSWRCKAAFFCLLFFAAGPPCQASCRLTRTD